MKTSVQFDNLSLTGRSTRREFLRAVGAGAAALAWARPAPSAEQGGDPWSQVPSILARIKPPVFPHRDFDVTRFGAVGDGGKDSTEAIRRAIVACNAAGGGRVVIPAGNFLTGAIHLLSNVELRLDSGAVLRFSTDAKQYLPVVFTRFEGTECMNYSPLIYAFEQQNIAVTGEGILDGQADSGHWWPWARMGRRGAGAGTPNDRQALIDMGDRGVPVKDRVFGEGHFLRPNFIQPYRCQNVLIDGIAIRNSPMWEIHPVLSKNVTVRNVKISSHGPNNDGCDPECCTDVLIENCEFDTGDDCIAVKAGKNADGRRVGAACENLVIRGCRMKDGHGGVSLGSEMTGGIRNLFAENCHMDSPHLGWVLRLKSNAARGGVMEHIYMRNVTVGQVAQAAVTIDYFYEVGEHGSFQPLVRDVEVENLACDKCKYALYLRGFANDPIREVTFKECSFNDVAENNVIQNVEGLNLMDVKINGKKMGNTESPPAAVLAARALSLPGS